MTTKILKITEADIPSAKDLCLFLADYSARLLASGATCIRINKNIGRIAEAYGMTTDLTVMPRHIHIAVADCKTDEIVTSIATVHDTGINFSINTELSRLSWLIADDKLSYREALERYNQILQGKSQSKWLVLMLVTLANASFCRLFGGDAIAMAIVALATMAGYYFKQRLVARKMDIRLVFIICSFISSVLGATDMLFSIGTTPELALGTSVLYLVPGIPFINSFSDMLYRHYLCAFSRFADALILTCSLSIGLCAGMSLMNVGMF
ncbi:MAG: threonine/serine exporter family protein [Muribaculaceae bacterium]|nr:threonine/serine exporter family protein [Muribaculaceae bacterium]